MYIYIYIYILNTYFIHLFLFHVYKTCPEKVVFRYPSFLLEFSLKTELNLSAEFMKF